MNSKKKKCCVNYNITYIQSSQLFTNKRVILQTISVFYQKAGASVSLVVTYLNSRFRGRTGSPNEVVIILNDTLM